MEVIMQHISTVGFPIVMSLILLYYIVSRLDRMTEIIENNTKALETIFVVLQNEGVDVENGEK